MTTHPVTLTSIRYVKLVQCERDPNYPNRSVHERLWSFGEAA